MAARRPTQHGMSVQRSDRLVEALRRAAAELRPQVVLETGTYLGQGTTQLLLEALADHPLEVFYTIEVSPAYYAEAVLNLAHAPVVHCLWGLTVGQSEAEAFIRNDDLLQNIAQYPDLYVDSDTPVDTYTREVRGAGGTDEALEVIPDMWLERLAPRVRSRRPLIALDSAGGIGWMEFQEVLRLMEAARFGLFLDDINHVKHYRSFKAMQGDPRFRIIDHDYERGWAVALFTPKARGNEQAAWS